MRKLAALFVVFCTLLLSISMPVQALDGPSSQQADIEVKVDADTVVVSINSVPTQVAHPFSMNSMTTSTATTVSFFPENLTEQQEILQRVEQLRRGGGYIYDDDWFLGDSCYMFISINFSTVKKDIRSASRIDSITTEYSVNSGTYITSAHIHASCIGTTLTESGFAEDRDIPVTTTPFTTSSVSNWPYIYNSGPSLGASFVVTAQRPSGTSETHTISANVFVN